MQRTEMADHSLENIAQKKYKQIGLVFLGPWKIGEKHDKS